MQNRNAKNSGLKHGLIMLRCCLIPIAILAIMWAAGAGIFTSAGLRGRVSAGPRMRPFAPFTLNIVNVLRVTETTMSF